MSCGGGGPSPTPVGNRYMIDKLVAGMWRRVRRHGASSPHALFMGAKVNDE